MNKLALISAISLISLSAFSGNNMKFERSLEMLNDRLSAVEFDVGAGSLDIIGTTGNQIKINATIESDDFSDMADLVDAFEDKMLFSIERQSEYAMVYAKSKDNMNWGRSKNIMIHLQVEVPRGMDLVIEDGSGSMSIENIDGELKIDDGSGHISLRDIGNHVQIDDGSGSIMITDVNGDLSIEDGSGTIEMKNITGSVDLKDGSGSILAKDIGGDFKVDDGSGEIVVKSLAGKFILVDDGSGSIHVNGERWDKK